MENSARKMATKLESGRVVSNKVNLVYCVQKRVSVWSNPKSKGAIRRFAPAIKEQLIKLGRVSLTSKK